MREGGRKRAKDIKAGVLVRGRGGGLGERRA